MKTLAALIMLIGLLAPTSPGRADPQLHMSKIPGQATLPIWRVNGSCPGDCDTILAECRKGPKVTTPDGGDECDYFHAICICDRCGDDSAQCKALVK